MTVVIGTAGHIDHGKTALLRALTGIDADRLPEERARGMTIDVGYAHLALDDGSELDFVDVPGHAGLIGNMLVGAGEIDAALVVVAADDGPRAQTIEHLQLLDALAIRPAVAVVTKADVVAADRGAEVVAAVEELLGQTSMAGAPVVSASATTGDGVPRVRALLEELRDRSLAERTSHGAPASARLAVDRVFAVRGRGTVITGTLRGGQIAAGDRLRVVPGRPGAVVRVREVQVHGRTVERAGPGRVALNVAGDDVRGLTRGAVLTSDSAVVASDRALVVIRPIPALGGRRDVRVPLPGDRSRMAMHAGTDHVIATLGRAGRESIDLADGAATALVRLERSIAVAAGDRFALRRPSPGSPVAGGFVIDPDPPRGVARRRATAGRVAVLATAEPSSPAWHAAALDLHGARPDPPALADDIGVDVDAALVDAAASEPAGARRAVVVAAGAAIIRRRVGPAATGDALDRLVIDRLGALVRDGQLVAAMDRLVERLTVVAPPPLAQAAQAVGCPPAGIRELERSSRIVRLDDDLAWAMPTYRDLAARALALASREPLTPAAYRDATGTSRKYVMAILEDLDRRAILRRTPDGHVPGPRAPSAARVAETGPAA